MWKIYALQIKILERESTLRALERERERESFVFIWTLCLSSEIFYVGEIERERDLVP